MMSFRALGLHSSTHQVVDAADDGLEPEDGLMRLGLWGATYMGPFPFALYYVLMSDLLKYNTIHSQLTLLQFLSSKIRRATLLNYVKLTNLLISWL